MVSYHVQKLGIFVEIMLEDIINWSSIISGIISNDSEYFRVVIKLSFLLLGQCTLRWPHFKVRDRIQDSLLIWMCIIPYYLPHFISVCKPEILSFNFKSEIHRPFCITLIERVTNSDFIRFVHIIFYNLNRVFFQEF